MKIGFVTFAEPIDYQLIVAPGIESHKTYCSHRHYDILNDVEDVYDRKRHAAWSKISLLLKHIENGYDWLFWIDADTIITNHKITLEDILSTSGIKKEQEILLTRDPRGTINTGIFFVRCSKWSKNFLETVYEYTQFNQSTWLEQTAISQLYKRDYEKARMKIHIENRTWKFNSYPVEKITLQNRPIRNIGLYHQGDFLVHFAGIHGEELRTAMRDFHLVQYIYGERNEENLLSNKYCGDNWDALYGKNRSLTWLPEGISE